MLRTHACCSTQHIYEAPKTRQLTALPSSCVAEGVCAALLPKISAAQSKIARRLGMQI